MSFWDLVVIGFVGAVIVMVVYNFFRHLWKDWRFRVAVKHMTQTLETAAMSMTLLNVMFADEPEALSEMAKPMIERIKKQTERYKSEVDRYYEEGDLPIPEPTSRKDK